MANVAAANAVDEAEENDDEQKSTTHQQHRQHDSGAADLEKVTDYEEEKELSAHASASFATLIDHKKSQDVKDAAKEKELAKITIRKEDVELIVHEMEVSKATAEKHLREHRGNLKETLKSMIAA